MCIRNKPSRLLRKKEEGRVDIVSMRNQKKGVSMVEKYYHDDFASPLCLIEAL